MRRVNEAVRAVVAQGVAQLKDPRIGLVTVTGVRVTSDLADATVYVSVLGNERAQQKTLTGLASARGVLQARINRELSLRRTPTLTFSYDETVERAVHMSKLIEDVTSELPELEGPPGDEPV
jgi:ribosome-binding factor A